MDMYYVNRNSQTNGDHEVHKVGCSFFPDAGNTIYLGIYADCRPAVVEARRYFAQVNGCYFCSPSCHTS